MPATSSGKSQQTIRSYGQNGSNRDKYAANREKFIRKTPRNEIPENEVPIEVCKDFIMVYRYDCNGLVTN